MSLPGWQRWRSWCRRPVCKKSACVSRVLACAVKKKKGETQKWRIGASIPVPLACEASDLPIDLIPQNETDANLAVYKAMERYNHHLSQHAHPTPASALCSYRASRHRDIRANHSKSAMPKARTNSTGAPPPPARGSLPTRAPAVHESHGTSSQDGQESHAGEEEEGRWRRSGKS